MVQAITKTDMDRIIADPAAHYQAPNDVLCDGRLSRAQKIRVLSQWAFDERELEVAEQENMRGSRISGPIILDQVMLALNKIEKEK